MVFNVSIDPHPTDDAVVIKYQANQETERFEKTVIHLSELTDEVSVPQLASLVLAKCPIIPASSKNDLEQVIFFLQKRNKAGSRIGSASSQDNLSSSPLPPLGADINEVDTYVELFYEKVPEKTRGAMLVLELTKNITLLPTLITNETLIGALTRVFREDWKKSFELAIVIAKIFVKFSYYLQFHDTLTHNKVGGLCLSTLEYELKRGEAWLVEAKSGDERTMRSRRVALKKQHNLLANCLIVLTNLSQDISVEVKMVRRDVVPLLLKCIQFDDCAELTLATCRLLLKLSIFEENTLLMENSNLIDRLLAQFPIKCQQLKKVIVSLLFNLSFNPKNRAKMVAGGLVASVAPLIESDSKCLNLLYQLSINDDAKAMITFTDAIQLLMRDLLSGSGSDVTKAILLNACIEKRNAQLVCGPDGQGLDLLMEAALDNSDLLVAKIIRSIAIHDGPTQDMFTRWIERLLTIGMSESVQSADERAAIGLECIGTAALIKGADWCGLCSSHKLVTWMGDQLRSTNREREPLQLQIVIMAGTMARDLESARALIPLLDSFLDLLRTMQNDDEFVVQLLYLFLQLLRHKDLSERLMGPESTLGNYVIELMHDKNAAVREICENALITIGEHSQEWARKIAAERFQHHNLNWLKAIAVEQELEETNDDDNYSEEVVFDDQYDDTFDVASEEAIF